MLQFNHFKIKSSDKIQVQNLEPALQLIAGDASDRKFFRLVNDDNGGAICMQFPQWDGGFGGDPVSWIGMHDALNHYKIPIPQILNIEKEPPCIWTQDLGDTFLGSALDEKPLNASDPTCARAVTHYKKALDLLVLAQYPDVSVEHPALNRLFDFEKLFYEMNFFVTHFFNGLLNLSVTSHNSSGLFHDLETLCQKLQSYEKVLCHRDYHSRNIMLYKDTVYWIDFQDARMGPHSYDVVSLLRDSYTDIPSDTRSYLLSYYFNALNLKREEHKKNKFTWKDFQVEAMLCGLQRNIKALGSFAYLATVKSKPHYLKYVAPTLSLLCSEQACVIGDLNLRTVMPNLFLFLDELHCGKYAEKLKELTTGQG